LGHACWRADACSGLLCFIFEVTLTDKLNSILGILLEEHDIKLAIGAELEFYLRNGEDITLPPDPLLQEKLMQHLQTKHYTVVKERGEGQFELQFPFVFEVLKLCDDISTARGVIQDAAAELGLSALFSAKPFADDYGSGLHFHVSLHDCQEVNIFQSKNIQAEDLLVYAIHGILYILETKLCSFEMSSEDLERFRSTTHMAPTHLCWGKDNRTVAVRIPTSGLVNRRLEFRIPSSSHDPLYTAMIMCEGILLGLSRPNLATYQCIYGNAFDEQYGLRKIVDFLKTS
jgi:glutamine synthetase